MEKYFLLGYFYTRKQASYNNAGDFYLLLSLKTDSDVLKRPNLAIDMTKRRNLIKAQK
jgi:hypothetical protein